MLGDLGVEDPQAAATKRDLADSVLAMAGGLRRVFDDVCVSEQISPPHFFMLSLLKQKSPLRMAELTERLDMSKGNLTYHVDRLVEADLARRSTSPDDRRRVYLELTEAGHKRHEGLLQALRERMGLLAVGMPTEELVAIQRGLALLTARIAMLDNA